MYTQNIYRAEHSTSSKLGSRIWQGWSEVFESFLLKNLRCLQGKLLE